MLAWKLCKQQTERSIFKIKNPATNVMCYTPEHDKSFEKHYKEPKAAEPSIIKSFLDSLDLPSIGVEQNEQVMQEITNAEIDSAVSRLKTNKVPGGDGFPVAWYKTFRDSVTPILLKCFNYVLNGGETPTSWRQDIISVIPEAGQNGMQLIQTCFCFKHRLQAICLNDGKEARKHYFQIEWHGPSGIY